MHAPIYRIYLKSELVSACVEVAEVNSLPVRGIDLLLGNDISGTMVNPEVTDGGRVSRGFYLMCGHSSLGKINAS